jgi:manganese/zinc/iron transport system permease protein
MILSESFLTLDFVPLLTSIFAALSCALLGNFLVLRKISLMGDAISHTVLPGIVFSFLIFETRGGPLLLLGATAAAIITTILVEVAKKLANLETGAAMGVVFSSLFALGVLTLEQAAVKNVDLDADCLLYGQLEGLIWTYPSGQTFLETLFYIPIELYTVIGVFIFTVLFVLTLFKELRLASFDPAMSTALGFNATIMHYLQMIITAAAVVAAFEAVGSILVIGMLICPAATARLLTDSLKMQLAISLLVAFCTATLGYFLGTQGPYWLGLDMSLSASGMMLVVAGLIFLVVTIIAPQYGLLAKVRHQRILASKIILEDILGILFRCQEKSSDDSIYTLSEIRKRIPHPCNNSLLKRAIRLGLKDRLITPLTPALIEASTILQLTKEGHQQAEKIVRSHRLWENYLLEHANLSSRQVHKPAQSLEHITNTEILKQLADQSSNPKVDPHGKNIP